MGEICKEVGAKHTLLLSNFQGFNKPVHFCGGLVKKFLMVATGGGNCGTFIAVVSILKRMQISISSDTTEIDDMENELEICNKN